VPAGHYRRTSTLARGDTLAVFGAIPFEHGTTASVSFDWNTVTGQVFNLNITDGFALIPGAILIDPESNAIAFMGFTRPNETPTSFGFGRDYMQIDGELASRISITVSCNEAQYIPIHKSLTQQVLIAISPAG
jgi:hypothetical protein